jgi:glycerol-3-phosphate acyltransferase PlsY
VVTPAALLVANQRGAALLLALMTVLIFIMHRANIGRLLSGTEGRIGQKG